MNFLDAIRGKLPELSLSTLRNLEISRGQVLKGVAYLVYGVVVFSLVFAAKFYVRQTDELVRGATANLQSVTVDFSYLDPQLFPPRVTLDYLRIHDKKTKRPILLLKDTDVRLSLLPLLIGKVSLSLKSRAYGGLVEADVATGMLFNTDKVSADVTMEMVELGSIPQVVDYDRTLKGFATIKTSLAGEWATPSLMDGELFAKVDRLDMENRFPVVKGPRLKDFTVVLDCDLEAGVMNVHDFDLLSADGISLKTDGKITLDQTNINLSVLDMTGKFIGPANRLAVSVLDPKAVAKLKKKQAVPVTVTGNVGKPSVLLK